MKSYEEIIKQILLDMRSKVKTFNNMAKDDALLSLTDNPDKKQEHETAALRCKIKSDVWNEAADTVEYWVNQYLKD